MQRMHMLGREQLGIIVRRPRTIGPEPRFRSCSDPSAATVKQQRHIRLMSLLVLGVGSLMARASVDVTSLGCHASVLAGGRPPGRCWGST
jgi:hypothetical protein